MKKEIIDYKTVRTKKQLLACPYVDEVFYEGSEDGWWVHFKEGYWTIKMECGLLHEMTIGELCSAFNEGFYKA